MCIRDRLKAELLSRSTNEEYYMSIGSILGYIIEPLGTREKTNIDLITAHISFQH